MRRPNRMKQPREYFRLYSQEWRKRNRSTPAQLKAWRAYHHRYLRERRAQVREEYGNRCMYPECEQTIRLCIHHDHAVQKRLKCCRSENGCSRCRVGILCNWHNTLLGKLKHSITEVNKALTFLRRYHAKG